MAVLFVVDVFVLPATNDLLLEGPGQRQMYASRRSVFRSCPKSRMLALRLDFSFSDVLMSGIWNEVAALEDPSLRSLVPDLLDLQMGSRASSNVTNTSRAG
ncbi:hypothetical protein P5673_014461 [Acropora cervicornis]|uniref:Secreted protein n=1 Tax=Acropora cervicornis TaxID=6130 RepID=A0AAD9V685_ACRCE|nr:hypothetical protein P5673_014461 [Acropora cervicornis]